MGNRSVSTGGNIDRSIVVTGNGNTASIRFGSDFTLPLVRRQIPPVRRRPLSADNPLPLLAADAGIFPLIGREDLIAELRAWLESPDDVSVLGLIARAGTGKTRLAVELCKAVDGGNEPGETGWSAGFLRPSDLASVVDQLARQHYDQARPTLLVIDYAAAVHRELARWLDRLAGMQFQGKLRFLLLDREAPEGFGWWQDLTRPTDSSNRADLFLDPERPRRLADLGADESRRLLFQGALDVASALMGDTAAGHRIPAPGEFPSFDAAIASPRFGNPLNLIMAGVIAAEKGAHEAMALRRLEAARYLARRERDRMVRLGESHGIEKPVMCHALGFNGLAGGLNLKDLRHDLAAELTAAKLPSVAAALPELLEQELPHDGSEGDEGAEPRLGTIQPDLLGEGVIIETLLTGAESHVGSAPAVLLRAYALTGGRCAEALMRLIQDYGYALEDPQASVEERAVAGPVLSLAPSLAEAIPDSDVERLEAFVIAIPHQTIILREVAAAQTLRLASIWRGILDSYEGDDEDLVNAMRSRLAGWLHDLANRLSDLGRLEEALAAVQEAVELFRALAAVKPRFSVLLAGSLNSLVHRLMALGRHDEVLALAQEATQLRRRLAAANPAEFMPELAGALNNLSIALSKLGRWEEALAAAQEAVDVGRGLAAARPDAFMPDLAGALNNLARRLSALGRRDEALAAAEEAVGLYRGLAAARPDVFTADLARSLSVLGDRFEEAEKLEQAVQVDHEAIRQLASQFMARPETFASAMSTYLNDYLRRSQAAGKDRDFPLIAPLIKMLLALDQDEDEEENRNEQL